jgi:hypothetical protein
MRMIDFSVTSEPIQSWGSGMWPMFAAMARNQQSRQGTPQERLEFDADVIDVFHRYHYAYDAQDLDTLMNLYEEEAVIVNPRGTYEGKPAIRENYAYLFAEAEFMLHYGTNQVVRPGKPTEAWLGAFYLAFLKLRDIALHMVGGTYLFRLTNRRGEWGVLEQRITANFRSELAPIHIPTGSPPTPTSPLNSFKLVGERRFYI